MDEFNRGEFFACHETLETLWKQERAPVRELMLMRVRALAGTGRAVEADLLGRSLLHALLPAPTEALLRRELALTALMRGQAATCIAISCNSYSLPSPAS